MVAEVERLAHLSKARYAISAVSFCPPLPDLIMAAINYIQYQLKCLAT